MPTRAGLARLRRRDRPLSASVVVDFLELACRTFRDPRPSPGHALDAFCVWTLLVSDLAVGTDDADDGEARVQAHPRRAVRSPAHQHVGRHVGRPFAHPAERIEYARLLEGQGDTLGQIAVKTGIPKASLHRYLAAVGTVRS